MTPYRLVVIMRKVRRDPDGCWEWTGAVDRDGYGIVGVDGTQRRAHRAIYEAKVGPIPDGDVLHHVCHNRRCVRPDHLEPMDPSTHSRQHDHQGRPLRTHCPAGHLRRGEHPIPRRGTAPRLRRVLPGEGPPAEGHQARPHPRPLGVTLRGGCHRK